MQVDIKKTKVTQVVPVVRSRTLLAVTTTVSLDVQGILDLQPSTLMMFCGMDWSVEH